MEVVSTREKDVMDDRTVLTASTNLNAVNKFTSHFIYIFLGRERFCVVFELACVDSFVRCFDLRILLNICKNYLKVWVVLDKIGLCASPPPVVDIYHTGIRCELEVGQYIENIVDILLSAIYQQYFRYIAIC